LVQEVHRRLRHGRGLFGGFGQDRVARGQRRSQLCFS
jgi:hypothetical protein